MSKQGCSLTSHRLGARMKKLLNRKLTFLAITIAIGTGCYDFDTDEEVSSESLNKIVSSEDEVALRYADGSAAKSCYDYFKSSGYNNEGDGYYWIDPDGSGEQPQVIALCDMTTNGGGWTLLVNRSGDTVNIESCGENLNDFFQSSCGNVFNVSFDESYNIGNTALRKNLVSQGDWRFQIFDSEGVHLEEQTYIIHNNGSDLFPDSVGEVNDLPVFSVCDNNDSNCDTTDVFFKWVGDRFFNIALCESGYFTGDRLHALKGVYGYCHDGLQGEANSKFGDKPGYESLKVWGHMSRARVFQEQIWVR